MQVATNSIKELKV